MRQPVVTLSAVLVAASVSWGQAPRPLNGEFQVNFYTIEDQLRSAVAVDAATKNATATRQQLVHLPANRSIFILLRL